MVDDPKLKPEMDVALLAQDLLQRQIAEAGNKSEAVVSENLRRLLSGKSDPHNPRPPQDMILIPPPGTPGPHAVYSRREDLEAESRVIAVSIDVYRRLKDLAQAVVNKARENDQKQLTDAINKLAAHLRKG